MEFVIASLFVVIGAFVFIHLADKVKVPHVVALIIMGLLFQVPALQEVFLKGEATSEFISQMGDFALIILMLLAGLSTSTKELLHEGKEALVISVIAVLTPFLIGFAVFKFIGFSTLAALIIGVTMAISAEATTAAVLLDLKKAKTRIGTLMMESGIIDDIMGLSIFIAITYFLKEFHLKEDILVSGAILAFFIGTLIQNRLKNHHIKIKGIKKTLYILVVPFFFVSMASHFDFDSLLVDPKVLILILVIAFFGKMGGTFLAKPFTGLSWKKLYLVGWALNSRGAIGLALALIAFRSELISVEIYSSLVIMILVTTTAFPLVVTPIIKKYPKLMD